MPFLGSALGYLIASPGWGNLVAFDWNDLPVGREFDCKFLKHVKSPPHALPPPTPHPPLVRWLSAKFWRDLYRADKSTKLCMVVA